MWHQNLWDILGNLFMTPVHEPGKQCDIAETHEEKQGPMPGVSSDLWAELPTAGRFTCFAHFTK